MALYRIYRLDPADYITDAYPIECRSDDVAHLNAACRVWQWAASVEVWKDSRRVARLTPDRLRTHCRTDTPKTRSLLLGPGGDTQHEVWRTTASTNWITADQIDRRLLRHMSIGHRGAGDGQQLCGRTVRLRSTCGRADDTLPALTP